MKHVHKKLYLHIRDNHNKDVQKTTKTTEHNDNHLEAEMTKLSSSFLSENRT